MISVIIVAGGKGLRMGNDIPKQFIPLCDVPILMRTISKFYNHPRIDEVVVVLPLEHQEYWAKLCVEYNFDISHIIATGGDTRFQSVRNGLQRVSKLCDTVFVHDAVRPFVSDSLITNLADRSIVSKAVIPVIGIVDSVREVHSDGASTVIDRSKLRLVQTPQVFSYDTLVQAYNLPYDIRFTDDSSVVDKLGIFIETIEGDLNNFKITTKRDLVIAGFIAE